MKKYLSFIFLLGIGIFYFIPHTFSGSDRVLDFFKGGSQAVDEKFFQDVIARIKKEYVEPVENNVLYEHALEGMLGGLDPHSGFFDQKTYQEVKVATSGEFAGIGAEVTMEKGYIKIISPYEGGPADKAGIKPGDYIVAIEGTLVKGMKLEEAVDKLRGASGSSVKITVFRETGTQTLYMNIKREKIIIKPVKFRLIAGDIGYLRISNFNEKVAKDLEAAVEELFKSSKNSLKGFVLDMRSNPGGLLDQSVYVADLFLNEGEIVKIKGRDLKESQVFKAKNGDVTKGLPIAVLINNGTASAPEIVAGALQDNKRAIIVGEKSFGKGSVQSIIPFPNGTAIKLTTARYYTPSGRSIQAEGIVPDIIVEAAVVKPIDKSNLILNSESSLRGHLNNESSSDQKQIAVDNPSLEDDLIKVNQDFQLLRAVDLVKGMSIYESNFGEE